MRQHTKSIESISILLAMTATLVFTPITYASQESIKLLTANFETREVVQVEIGEFHFKPGQVAPIHTHAAPAVGYVAKGEIIYQVEGEKPQILREGDAFYEPVGPRILRFDNASATEEAIFLDFNLEQVGEPFIVFEKPPTEAIDRRSLPTIDITDRNVDQVDIYVTELANGDSADASNNEPSLGLVAEGVIELQVSGKPAQRYVAGQSFDLAGGKVRAIFVNDSNEIPAKVITFRLK